MNRKKKSRNGNNIGNSKQEYEVNFVANDMYSVQFFRTNKTLLDDDLNKSIVSFWSFEVFRMDGLRLIATDDLQRVCKGFGYGHARKTAKKLVKMFSEAPTRKPPFLKSESVAVA